MVSAETRYVSDEFRITMRRGPAATFKVVRMLKTGVALDVLEKDPSGWDQVRTLSGLEGWVLHRFTSADPPAREQLNAAKEAMRVAQGESERFRIEAEELRKRVGSQEKLESELSRIRKVSHNALEIERENEVFSQKIRQLEKDIKRISDDKRVLERQSDTLFFVAGAVVFVVGLIGGAILARRRRNNSFGGLS